MVKQILDIIEEMNSSNSNLHKLDVIATHKDNESFRNVLWYTYNEMNQYYMGLKTFTAIPQGEGIGIEGIFTLLDGLRSRKMKTQDANFLGQQMSEDEHKLFSMIIDRNLRVKVDSKSINKALGMTLIPVVSYMRCSLPKDGNAIKYPAFSQLKSDGMFVNIIVDYGKVEIISRNGKPLISKKLESMFSKLQTTMVFNGELLVMEDGKPMARQLGNGLLTSLSKRASTTQTIEEKLVGANAKQHQKLMKELKDKNAKWDATDDNIYLNVWDCIPFEYWKEGKTYDVPYSKRFELVKVLLSGIDEANPIESRIVNSYEEATQHFNEVRERGEEGTIIKNMDGFWENKTSKNQIKLKAEKEVELEVVGWNKGEDDFKDGIGSLICQSSCGRLRVNVSGMKRHERGLEPVDKADLTKGLKLIEGFAHDYYTGKIVTVLFNEVIQNKEGEYSLFLPRIVKERPDKNVADDLEYILKV